MKTKFYYITALGLLSLVWVFNPMSSKADEKPSNKDIIKFSHSFHAEMEVACADCHNAVPESASLSDNLLPTMDACASCHDVEDDENCETCHYEDVYETFTPAVTELVFDHSFHMEEQEMECQTCHKGFTEVDYGSELETANPDMGTCFSCHNNQTVASNACESCHISTANLTPESHTKVDFFDNHKFSANHPDADCAMCHDDNFCETCHVSTVALDAQNTASDFYTPYSPHTYTDNTKQQQITRVHDLNYRFTHGIDAKGKTFECTTCHETETFCNECHQSSGGDYALGGFVPLSHSQPDFTTLGVGTGGGLHAELARRDIESCASCHETQGADANCIICHTDNDGIEGTNPRTHEVNFMKDIEGDWHSDAGAVCFDCHTDPFAQSRTAGQGFCGYCHN